MATGVEVPNFFLTKILPALVHRDLVQPRAESRALVEAFQRQIRFYERLLGYIFDILITPQYSANDGKQALLVHPHQILISGWVPGLRAPYELPLDRSGLSLGSGSVAN